MDKGASGGAQAAPEPPGSASHSRLEAAWLCEQTKGRSVGSSNGKAVFARRRKDSRSADAGPMHILSIWENRDASSVVSGDGRFGPHCVEINLACAALSLDSFCAGCCLMMEIGSGRCMICEAPINTWSHSMRHGVGQLTGLG